RACYVRSNGGRDNLLESRSRCRSPRVQIAAGLPNNTLQSSYHKPLTMDECRSCGFKCERLDVLSARDGCLIFDVTAAFVELAADKIDLLSANGADGISNIEGKVARVGASEPSRGDASEIDGQTERSKCAGAHESTWGTSEFQSTVSSPKAAKALPRI
ncbi:MAG TPA: hypothetical protein VGM66_11030, partial [Candidatus Udaeobacter sp.]